MKSSHGRVGVADQPEVREDAEGGAQHGEVGPEC